MKKTFAYVRVFCMSFVFLSEMQSKQQPSERLTLEVSKTRATVWTLNEDDKETSVKGDVSQHLSPPIEVGTRGDNSSYGVWD